MTVETVIEDAVGARSAWHRMDVLRGVCDRLRPQPGVAGERWARCSIAPSSRCSSECVDLDPARGDGRRAGVGWPVGVDRTGRRPLHERQVFAQEEHILTWAIDAQARRTRTVDDGATAIGLDVLQADAAAAVAGHDRLVVIVGPAGAGKTTHARRRGRRSRRHSRPVFGVAPTAKAARVLGTRDRHARRHGRQTAPRMGPTRRPRPAVAAAAVGTTLVVDEAGMLTTRDLHRLTRTRRPAQQWRLVARR